MSDADRLRGLLNTALNMLELIASKMPAGADLRRAIEAECAAMRSAAKATPPIREAKRTPTLPNGDMRLTGRLRWSEV